MGLIYTRVGYKHLGIYNFRSIEEAILCLGGNFEELELWDGPSRLWVLPAEGLTDREYKEAVRLCLDQLVGVDPSIESAARNCFAQGLLHSTDWRRRCFQDAILHCRRSHGKIDWELTLFLVREKYPNG